MGTQNGHNVPFLKSASLEKRKRSVIKQLCEKCRGQVCGYDSFCDECRSWTKDFRRMYLKHQRTLHQKRVSKGNAKAKAKSPPVVDDAASNVSMESHVSVPVVILPLDPQSVDVDDNLSNLGNIQNIDNIVEIRSQPEIPPPPTHHLCGF